MKISQSFGSAPHAFILLCSTFLFSIQAVGQSCNGFYCEGECQAEVRKLVQVHHWCGTLFICSFKDWGVLEQSRDEFGNPVGPLLHAYALHILSPVDGSEAELWGCSEQVGVTPNPTPTPLPVDLSVNKIEVVSGKALDGSPLIKPDQEYDVNIEVSGSGIQADDARNTLVRMRVGTLTFEQTVPLSSLVSTGSTVVPFKLKLSAENAGKNTIEATINPLFLFDEQTILNNVRLQGIQMLCSVEEKGTAVPFFSQSFRETSTNPNLKGRWGDDQYANSVFSQFKSDGVTPNPKAGQPIPMSKLGCLTTSLAMLFNAYGIKTANDGSVMDPGSVNKGFKSSNYTAQLGPEYSMYNGYTPANDVQPNGAVAFARDSFYKQCIKRVAKLQWLVLRLLEVQFPIKTQ